MITGVEAGALELLQAHSWPGNIRELENVIEHAFVIETGNQISRDSLPASISGRRLMDCPDDVTGIDANDSDDSVLDSDTPSTIDVGFKLSVQKLDFQASKEEFERQFLISALKAFKGRINQTALHANIPKKTLLRKLEKYGINARQFTGKIDSASSNPES
jgi:DNA-binding NtrC family response regulator